MSKKKRVATEEREHMTSKSLASIEQGDFVWFVSDGLIYKYVFIEDWIAPDLAEQWLLAYGKHPKQRKWVDAKKCFVSRADACRRAAKTLRQRAADFLVRAAEMEQEAAGLPVEPRAAAMAYLPKKEGE